ncbi:beta-ketoacyl-ACP synthase II [soil metagenome]
MDAKKRVVITGIGAVSPNGVGREAFAAACLAGKSGIGWIDGVDTAGLKSSVAAQVRGFDPQSVLPAVELRRVPRMVPMALAASREALQQAGLLSSLNGLIASDSKSTVRTASGVPSELTRRAAGGSHSSFAKNPLDDLDVQRSIAVALGTGGGGLGFVEQQYREMFTGGQASLYSITGGTHGNLSSELSIALHLRGPSHVISTGCTSSTDALGYAAMMIRAGVVPMVLAGGADSPIEPGILSAFEKMRVVSTRRWDEPGQSSRPFSIDRDGFVLGEGAWMFVLEDADHAAARGATVLAEIAGYGSTCDAFHRVQIAPDVVEPVRAMQLAMAEAGVDAGDIDYINLHGTSTELNDRMETQAVKKCFGERAARIPMSSTKSMIGHPQGACGAAGIAATVLSMLAGAVHPTINLDRADPSCDLDYVPNVARKVRVRTALCNCIAFGSKNSALVIKNI